MNAAELIWLICVIGVVGIPVWFMIVFGCCMIAHTFCGYCRWLDDTECEIDVEIPPDH